MVVARIRCRFSSSSNWGTFVVSRPLLGLGSWGSVGGLGLCRVRYAFRFRAYASCTSRLAAVEAPGTRKSSAVGALRVNGVVGAALLLTGWAAVDKDIIG